MKEPPYQRAMDYLMGHAHRIPKQQMLDVWRNLDVGQFTEQYTRTATTINVPLQDFDRAFMDIFGVTPRDLQPEYDA